MDSDQPNFQSLRIIRDNTLLISIASEYISENIFMEKFGKEIKKCLSVLKNDIISLKKQFPGKFTQEVNTDGIISSFENTAEEMLSGSEEIKNNCRTGKLAKSLDTDVDKITEAIDKIWHQVKGSDVKYTTSDSIGTFFDRLNIFSGIASLLKGIVKVLFIIVIILLAGFSYLYFTMEKEAPILEENKEIMAFIEEEKIVLQEFENKKADAQKELKKYKNSELLRKDKIAILDIETRIQEINQDIHKIEGQIDAHNKTMEQNNEKMEAIRSKPFLDKLLKQ